MVENKRLANSTKFGKLFKTDNIHFNINIMNIDIMVWISSIYIIHLSQIWISLLVLPLHLISNLLILNSFTETSFRGCLFCVQEPVFILKEVMYQENANSWYITLFFRLLEAVSGTDVPKISRNLSHHLCPRTP